MNVTLLPLSVVDLKAKERWLLAPQQSHVSQRHVQLENRGVHVISPEDVVPVHRDPIGMV